MEPATFERIRALLKERAAIVIEPGQEYLVESRLEPIVRARGYRNVDELCQRLRTDGPELTRELIEAMTTNETSFFRDHHPFQTLQEVVLPDLIAKRAEKRRLDIWCAASSTGQEPYSIAILLREHFPELASWNVNILATDLSSSVLARARCGRYRQIDVNRGMSAKYLVKYFKRDGLEFEIDDQVKRMVRFEELNLVQSWPLLPTFDVVFIRNVLIYFDAAAKRSVLSRTRRQLAPDGYLFLGGSEALPSSDLDLEKLPIARAGCYRSTRGPGERRHA